MPGLLTSSAYAWGTRSSTSSAVSTACETFAHSSRPIPPSFDIGSRPGRSMNRRSTQPWGSRTYSSSTSSKPSPRTSGSTSASARDTTSCRWVLSAMLSPRNEKSGHGAHFSRCCSFEKCRRAAYHVGPRRRKAVRVGPSAELPGLRAHSSGGPGPLGAAHHSSGGCGPGTMPAMSGSTPFSGAGRSAFSRFRCSRFSAFSRCFCWRASSFRRLVAPGAAMANLLEY